MDMSTANLLAILSPSLLLAAVFIHSLLNKPNKDKEKKTVHIGSDNLETRLGNYLAKLVKDINLYRNTLDGLTDKVNQYRMQYEITYAKLRTTEDIYSDLLRLAGLPENAKDFDESRKMWHNKHAERF
jgi:hypothetical protein